MEPIRLEDCTVHETTASVWHYHLVLGEDGDAICGREKAFLFANGLPATRFWRPGVKSHVPYSYCKDCRRLVGDSAADGWIIPEEARLSEVRDGDGHKAR